MSYIKIVCVKYLFILFYTLNKFLFLMMLTLLYVIMKNVKHGSEFIYIYIYIYVKLGSGDSKFELSMPL